MNQLAKTDLILLDDWGIQKIAAAQRSDLMEVIEDRHGLRSTLIASQLPIEHWHEFIGEGHPGRCHSRSPTSQRPPPPLKGESLRKRQHDHLDTQKTGS